MAERAQPDIVVMDTQLPVVSGVEATALIGAAAACAVLLLTLGTDDEQILAMLRAGATGCLLKDAEVEELLLAVRTVHRGGVVPLARSWPSGSRRTGPLRDRPAAGAAEGAALGARARGAAAGRGGARQPGDRAEAGPLGQDGRGAQGPHRAQARRARADRADQVRDPDRA